MTLPVLLMSLTEFCPVCDGQEAVVLVGDLPLVVACPHCTDPADLVALLRLTEGAT